MKDRRNVMNPDEAKEGNRRVFLASSFHAAFGNIVTGIETATQALQTQTLISRRTVEKGIAGITLLTVAGVVIGGGNPNILSTPRSPVPIAHPNETLSPPTEDLAFSEINNNKQSNYSGTSLGGENPSLTWSGVLQLSNSTYFSDDKGIFTVCLS
jgi:hypothetical protein